MFEVGKKYIGVGSATPIYECIDIGTCSTVFKDGAGYHKLVHQSFYGSYKEYKEPRRLEGWVNVFLNEGTKEIFFSGDYVFESKEQAQIDVDEEILYKFIKTIKITYEEGQDYEV